jgi:predicted PurR-regulated permease PerM
MGNSYKSDLKTIKNILICVLVVLTIYFAGEIVMPIIFSAFLAIMLSPLQKKMEGWQLLLQLLVLRCQFWLWSLP